MWGSLIRVELASVEIEAVSSPRRVLVTGRGTRGSNGLDGVVSSLFCNTKRARFAFSFDGERPSSSSSSSSLR